MEKKLAEYKCDTNEAICLKLGKYWLDLLYVLFNEDDHTMNFMTQFAMLCEPDHCCACMFAPVRFPEDLEDDGTTFHPEYSHQLYGDE